MAAAFSNTDDLRGAEFVGTDLQGARFVEADLSGIVVRGSVVHGAEIESPWLLEGGGSLRVNGVDVVPLVDAELNRRFPGRELRGAGARSAHRRSPLPHRQRDPGAAGAVAVGHHGGRRRPHQR